MGDLRTDLEILLREIGRDLGRELQLRPPCRAVSPDLPLPLRDFYCACDGGDIGFGALYSQEQLESRAAGFAPDWIPFGWDNRFSFWLCARNAPSGLWLTTWDHESRTEIEGATSTGLVAFLREEYERRLSERSPENSALVLASVPPSARAAAILEVKILCELGTATVLERLRSLPVELPVRNVLEARAALVRLRDRGVEGHLLLDFFLRRATRSQEQVHRVPEAVRAGAWRSGRTGEGRCRRTASRRQLCRYGFGPAVAWRPACPSPPP
jgi:hypothetical protein